MAGTNTTAIHRLKCEAQFFDDIEAGRKTGELRRDDRGYCVGDTLELTRTRSGLPTRPGRKLQLLVTHIVRGADGPWLSPGYVMLSFRTL